MTMCEHVIPGVGVYSPEDKGFECDAARVGKIKHYVKRLTIHVHDLETLQEALSQDVLHEVVDLTVDFRKAFSFGSLMWGLEDFDAYHLLNLKITGGHNPNLWEVDCLRTMFKTLVPTTINYFGMENNPREVEYKDEVIPGWFRHHGDTVAVMDRYLPLLTDEIKKCKPKHLEIDCNRQLHTNWILPFRNVEKLTLFNVETDSTTLFPFIDALRVGELRMTGCLERWRKAIAVRLTGTRFALS